MPTYDYECTSCGDICEKFHAMSETPEVICEKCGSPSKKKIGGGNGLIFKGSGFYVTDYKSSGENKGGGCCSGGNCSSH